MPYKTLFGLLLKAAQNPLIIVDGKGNVCEVNESSARLFGTTREALLGRDLMSMASGELGMIYSGQAEWPELKVGGPSGEPQTYRVSVWRSGQCADESFALIELSSVSGRDKIESQLEAERDKFRIIINSMGDGLGIVDKNFKIRFMNKVLTQIAGGNALGKECYKVYTGNDKPCLHCPLKRGIGNLDINTVEVEGANDQAYLITHYPIKDADGNIAVLEILKDISENKRLEKKLLDSERRAILSQFSSSLAHDLRNPIVGINKTLQMLLGNYDGFEKEFHIKKLADLASGSALLLGLVNDMLDIFQDSYASLAMRKSFFNFHEAVHEALPLLKADAEEKGISLIFQPCPEEPFIFGDKRRLQRVIINLLDNAIKFTRPDESIVLMSRITSSHGSDGNDFLFSIEDKGPGINEAELNKIFDLFYKEESESQAKPSTGIGLYFCKVIVEAHGGKIWAENKVDGGSVFRLILPI